ncbi:hypothetical protein JCM6882_000345 [Rhodosporidiobolus microsporus]
MPPVFGGAPTCPRCQKAVYFAEQTLGPGGVAFHKLCLKCTVCGRLLEPRLLVDHEGEAYCKACHSKAYGTKGYGAGGALVGEYTPRSPSAASPANSSPSRPRPAPPPKPDFDEDDTRDSPLSLRGLQDVVPRVVPRSSVPFAQAPPQPPPRPVQAEEAEPEKKAAPIPSFDEGETREAPPSALPPPVAVPSITSGAPASPPRAAPPPLAPKPKPPLAPKPSSTAAAPPSPTSTSSAPAPPAPPPRPETTPNTLRTIPLAPSSPASYASPPRFAVASGSGSPASRNKDLCPKCGTVVYFAEEVRAVGAKWHKRCLRCSSCSTALSPSALTERDGQPYCKKCYGEQWGLGGVGVMTRPNLY